MSGKNTPYLGMSAPIRQETFATFVTCVRLGQRSPDDLLKS